LTQRSSRKEKKRKKETKEEGKLRYRHRSASTCVTYYEAHVRGGWNCCATGCSFTESGSSICKTRLVHPAPALSACTATHGQGALRLLTPFLDGLAHQSAGTGHNIIGKTKAESFECARHTLVSAQLCIVSGCQLAWSKEFCVARH